MATVNLGKVKLKWRGTYAGGTAYTPDDVVYYVDGSVGSSYICVANTTGNAPSSGGTAHASWNYLAKGQATSPTTTQGDLIVRGASADQRLAIGTAGQALKVNSSANGLEYGSAAGMALIASGTVSSSNTLFSVDNCFTDTYDYYKMVYMYGSSSWMKMRYINSDGSILSASGYYFAGSWYRRDAGGSHDVGQFGYYNQNYVPLGYFDGQSNQPSFGEFNFLDPKNSSYKTQYWGSCASKHSGHTKRTDLVGSYDSPSEVRGFQFFVDNGSYPMTPTNFHFRLYGLA